MQELLRYRDDQGVVDVPSDRLDAFRQERPQAERLQLWRDGQGQQTYVPESRLGDFQKSIPDAERLQTWRDDQGQKLHVPESRLGDFRKAHGLDAPSPVASIQQQEVAPVTAPMKPEPVAHAQMPEQIQTKTQAPVERGVIDAPKVNLNTNPSIASGGPFVNPFAGLEVNTLTPPAGTPLDVGIRGEMDRTVPRNFIERGEKPSTAQQAAPEQTYSLGQRLVANVADSALGTVTEAFLSPLSLFPGYSAYDKIRDMRKTAKEGATAPRGGFEQFVTGLAKISGDLPIIGAMGAMTGGNLPAALVATEALRQGGDALQGYEFDPKENIRELARTAATGVLLGGKVAGVPGSGVAKWSGDTAVRAAALEAVNATMDGRDPSFSEYVTSLATFAVLDAPKMAPRIYRYFKTNAEFRKAMSDPEIAKAFEILKNSQGNDEARRMALRMAQQVRDSMAERMANRRESSQMAAEARQNRDAFARMRDERVGGDLVHEPVSAANRGLQLPGLGGEVARVPGQQPGTVDITLRTGAGNEQNIPGERNNIGGRGDVSQRLEAPREAPVQLQGMPGAADGVQGETAGRGAPVQNAVNTGFQRLENQPQKVPTIGNVEQPAPAAAESPIVDVPVAQVRNDQIAVRPELMQFKQISDPVTGVTEDHKNTVGGAKWDDVKGGNILLWEPLNPAEYGLQGNERYILADGHGRMNFARSLPEGKRPKGFNTQILREADGVSASDARVIAALRNIADGKGTVYDQARALRNIAGTRGQAEAESVARAEGIRGRIAAKVAFNASDDVYTAFVNEKITGQQAATLAEAGAGDAAAQQFGLKFALDGKDGQELKNIVEVAKNRARNAGGPQASQLDLFGQDDTAIREMEQQAAQATKIQRQLDENIRVLNQAMNRGGKLELTEQQAAALGITDRNNRQQISDVRQSLNMERERWEKWAMHPDLVERVMGRPQQPDQSVDANKMINYQPAGRPGGETLPSLKQGYVRVVHLGSSGISDSIKRNGLDYSKQGMLQSTARYWDSEKDVEYEVKGDRRFEGLDAYVFDIPSGDIRLHNDISKSPGKIDSKYYVGTVKGSKSSSEYTSTPGTTTTPAQQAAEMSARAAAEAKPPESFTLQQETPADVAARRANEQRKAKIAARDGKLSAPMQGTAGDLGQMDMFPNNANTDLFNRPASGGAASPGYGVGGGQPGVASVGNGGRPADSYDPQSQHIPLQMPEMLSTMKKISGRSDIVEMLDRIRLLKGMAAGAFYPNAGNEKIQLRRDLFHVVSPAEERALYAEAMSRGQGQYPDDAAKAYQFAKDFYNTQHAQMEADRVKQEPAIAAKVFAHEIGHWIDFLGVDKVIRAAGLVTKSNKTGEIEGRANTLARGNFLGHIAAVYDYTKKLLPKAPDNWGDLLSKDEIDRLRRQARVETKASSVNDVVQEIRREVPIFEQVKLAPEDILNIWNNVERARDNEQLYRFVAGLSSGEKKSIIMKAMQGLVDERLNGLAGSRQIGTETVVERVVVRQGKQKTEKERFKELLQEELEKRNIFQMTELLREIEPMIAWWNGTSTMPAYYKKPAEMYADAFSVWINNPAAVARMAPKYYQAMVNWMDARPQFAKEYRAMRNMISQGMTNDRRLRDLEDMWSETDAMADEVRISMKKVESWSDAAITGMFDPMWPTTKRMMDAKKMGKGDVSKAFDKAQRDWLYRTNATRLMLTETMADVLDPFIVENNIPVAKFNTYLFLRHVINNRFSTELNPFGESTRQMIASPNGYTAATAQDTLSAMERELGPDVMNQMRQAEQARWNVRKASVFPVIERSGLVTPEMMKKLLETDTYSTVAVMNLDKDPMEEVFTRTYGNVVGPKIYPAKGTMKAQVSPILATIQKDISLMQAAEMNILKSNIVGLLREVNDPHFREFSQSEWSWNEGTKRREPKVVDNSVTKTMIVMENGKPNAYHVPAEVADMLDRMLPADISVFLRGVKRLTNFQKSLYTAFNYGFWPMNYMRDRATAESQIPGMYAQFVGPGAYQKYHREANAAAKSLVEGRPNEIARRALERRVITMRTERMTDDKNVHLLEKVLSAYHVDATSLSGDSKSMKDLPAQIWKKYVSIGETLEAEVKIAGMLHLERTYPNMNPADIQRLVQDRSGSPNFMKRGTFIDLIDLVFPFSNPMIRGYETAYKSAKENPYKFTFGLLKYTIGAQLAVSLAEMGLRAFDDDDEKEMWRSISQYDKDNYYILPLGWDDYEQRKVRFLRLPIPEMWKIPRKVVLSVLGFDEVNSIADAFKTAGDTIGYGAGQLPGLNPVFTAASKWAEFIGGQAPSDRAGQIVSDREMDAGQGTWTMAKWTFNQLSGGIFWRFQNESLSSPDQTSTQKALNLPIVSNLIGRYLRVSNAGIREEQKRLLQSLKTHEAIARNQAYEKALSLKHKTMEPAEFLALQATHDKYGNQFDALVLGGPDGQREYLEAYKARAFINNIEDVALSAVDVNSSMLYNARPVERNLMATGTEFTP